MLLKYLIPVTFLLFITNTTIVSAEKWVQTQNNVSRISKAPQFKFPRQIGALRAVISQGQQHPYITTGYFFKKGDLRNLFELSAHDYQKKHIAVQIKPMNYYKDGSVRFAIITLKYPNPSSNIIYDIALIKRRSPEIMRKKMDFKLPNFKVKITSSLNKSKIIDLNYQIAMERELWQKGPLLYQKRYFAPVTSDLIAQFDISFFDNGNKSIDVALKNTNVNAKKTLKYHVEFTHNNKALTKAEKVTHNPHTIWRKSFHFGFKENNHPIHDMQRLINVGALPSYDLNHGMIEGADNLDQHYNNVMFSHDVMRYIFTQKRNQKDIILRDAQKADLLPIHFIDPTTQQAATPQSFSNLFLKNDKIYPISSYIPFIITGKRYLYDHLKSFFMLQRLRINPKYQQDGYRYYLPTKLEHFEQLYYSTALLQTVMDTKHDIHAEEVKQYQLKDWSFIKNITMNYKIWGENKYILGELTGLVPHSHLKKMRVVNVPQQDRIAIVTGFAAGMDLFPQLKEFVSWQAEFVAGRFLQNHNLMPSFNGFASFYDITDRKRLLQKWSEVKVVDHLSSSHMTIEDHINKKVFPPILRKNMMHAAAANAQIFNITQNNKAIEAFGYIMSYFSYLEKDFQKDPSLAIMPFIEGTTPLKLSDIIVGNDWNDNLEKQKPNALIHGKNGNDYISVRSGHGFLFGGGGNDKITAGSSDSILFGGDGKDILVAGIGNDVLKGDSHNKNYKDIFRFIGPTIGHNIILDFTPGVDKIHILPSLNIAQYQYSNRLEGLSFDRRRGGARRDPKCDKLSQEEQDKREECLEYRRYYNANRNDYEFIKELDPDIDKYIAGEKKRLRRILDFLRESPQSKRYKRARFELNKISKQSQILAQEQNVREQLSALSKVTDLREYRRVENELENIIATKRIVINNILGASRFGNKFATTLLNAKAIDNIGIKNYFRPSPDGGTIIDFNINMTPEKHMLNTTDPISSQIGSINIKGISPEKITRDDFIFGF